MIRPNCSRKKHTPPLTRRKFGTIWGELAYLCKKIHYWLYVRKQKGYAGRYGGRLEQVLHDLPGSNVECGVVGSNSPRQVAPQKNVCCRSGFPA